MNRGSIVREKRKNMSMIVSTRSRQSLDPRGGPRCCCFQPRNREKLHRTDAQSLKRCRSLLCVLNLSDQTHCFLGN